MGPGNPAAQWAFLWPQWYDDILRRVRCRPGRLRLWQNSRQGLARSDYCLEPSSISPVSVLLTGLSFLLLTALAAFYSTAASSVRVVPRGRLQQLAADGKTAASELLWLSNRQSRFDATINLVSTTPSLLAATFLVWHYGRGLTHLTGGNQWVVVLFFTVIISMLVALIADYLPKLAAARMGEATALSFARPLRITAWFCWPLVWLLETPSRLFFRPISEDLALESPPVVTEADLKLQLDAAEQGGVLDEAEREMIHSIFDFGDTLVREIMVPRVYVVTANTSKTAEEVLDLALSAGLSRMPIYEDDIDHIRGIFYVKDAARAIRQDGQQVELRQMLRPAHFVPETKRVGELLREMRQTKTHLAIVIDEYGGTAGLVTIEDILEEIVGEIQDEFDSEEALIRQLSEREALVDALATLAQVNELLSLNLDAHDIDTVGGFVYTRLGRVPEAGDEVFADGARLTVVAVDRNRIKKIRVLTPVESIQNPAPLSQSTE